MCLLPSPQPPYPSRLAELTLDQPQRPRSLQTLQHQPANLHQQEAQLVPRASHSNNPVPLRCCRSTEHRPVLQVPSCPCHVTLQGRSPRRYSHLVCPRRPRRRVTTVTAPPGALGCLSFCHSHSRRDTVWVGTGGGFNVLPYRSGC